MDKIRVLHCLETVGSGGVEQTRLSLVKCLDSSKYEQRIICTKAIGGLPELFQQEGCEIIEVGEFERVFDFERYRRATAAVKDFKPHIIHGAVFEGVNIASIVGRRCSVPVIIGEETSDPQNRSWKGSLLYRGLVFLIHHMVAVSPAVERYLRNKIFVPKRKVTMVANGVAEKPAPTRKEVIYLRKELGISDSDFVIGTVGRLFDEPKRVSDLLRAFEMLLEHSPNAKLLIVGTGPDEDMLKTMAKNLGIFNRVIFAGYQVNTRIYYELMDVFCLPSAFEAFGLVLVEAMYAGVPVVATRTGGIPRVVVENETALLSPPFDPKALSHNIFKLYDSPELRENLSVAGLVRARNEFSEDRYVSDIDTLYTRLLTERGMV